MPGSPQLAEGRAELGLLLALLHDAEHAFSCVHATWRVWRHEERLHQAFVADAEEQRERGASISIGSQRRDAGEPIESDETVRIWRDGDRFREEHSGGRRDGHYAVADGRLWWIWDERSGGYSNHDEPSVSSSVGQELAVLLDPTALLSVLRFRVTGRSEIAGRATITARATPRPPDRHGGRALELYQLGGGAQEYELEVDTQRGVLLAAVAFRDGEPFHQITALEISFDEPIADAVFRFVAPEGQEIRTRHNDSRLRRVTLTEAQRDAPFTVLMPDRVPADWQVSCTLLESSRRPPSPPEVSLSYDSHDGHQSVSISQLGASDRAAHHYDTMVDGDEWETINVAESTIHVRPAEWGQAQAYLEREGTFVFLVSDNLTNEQLGSLAGRLVPAPLATSLE